jgi:hypothetical protein
MLQPLPKPSTCTIDFWLSLGLFWDKDRINKWKKTIFPDPRNPDIGVERCFNLISLSLSAVGMWNRGLFALKPLKLSHDRKKLTVQFFWQVPGNYKIDDEVDLLTETPSLAKGSHIVGGGHFLTRFEEPGSIQPICSGDTFTFTTKDPEKLPLPSLELLEMQWILQRVVGMCGAAKWPNLDDIDDDSDDDWTI